MVHVQLEKEWTDQDGSHYPAGAWVDVDAGTLAELQAQEIVAEPDGAGWVGPTSGGNSGGAQPDGAGWVGPTSGNPGTD